MQSLQKQVVKLHNAFVAANISPALHPHNIESFDEIVMNIQINDDNNGEGRSTDEWITAIKKYGNRPPSIAMLNNILRKKDMTCIDGRWYYTTGIRATFARIARTLKRATLDNSGTCPEISITHSTFPTPIKMYLDKGMSFFDDGDKHFEKYMGWNLPL